MEHDHHSTEFTDLPNELILEIAEYFRPIRTYETQSQAFKFKEKEKKRQRENHQRQCTLHALCLTSKRIKEIIEPILYSALVSSATLHGNRILDLFYETLTKRPELGPCIRYVENRLSTYRGDSLFDDLNQKGSEIMVPHYFDTLAAVIRSGPNLTHLSVVSLEETHTGLWRGLLPNRSRLQLAHHGCPKLQTLCVQLHVAPYHRDFAVTGPIFNALLQLPKLEQLDISGADSYNISLAGGKFKALNSLGFWECDMDPDDVAHIISACTALTRIDCQFQYSPREFFDLPSFHDALLGHKETLEHFHLDIRKLGDGYILEELIHPLGSFRDFCLMKSLALCHNIPFGNSDIGEFSDRRIAHELPPLLETFTLMIVSDWHPEVGVSRSIEQLLWNLVEDSPKMLPNLKTIHVRTWTPLEDLFSSKLTTLFEKHGILWSLSNDEG